MNTGSTVADGVRETAKEAREDARDVRKAANDASGDMQSDLRALHNDLGRLAEEIGDLVAGKGNAAWRRARSSAHEVVSDAQDKGREALGTVRDVSDNLIEAIDESIKKRPYATLALVAGLGFVVGATWRR